MIKSFLLASALAAGLLLIDVALPVSAGSTAQAAPPRRVVPVTRPRPAARMNIQRNIARPARVNVARPKIQTQKIIRARPAPHFVTPKALRHQVGPKNLRTQPNIAIKPSPTPQAQGAVNKLKPGPSLGKQLVLGPGVTPKGNFLKLGNKAWPIHKGPHKIWWKGAWKTFLPFSAISVVLIGGAYYYPDAYVSIARPYCAGTTPDGCYLNWQEVAFEGGGSDWQCVEFCPRPDRPPPAQAASLVIPSATPARGRCELEIFAGPGFAGASAPTDVDQPRLAEAGWKNEISSMRVTAGTWDFFSEDDFAGDAMRLPPGAYPQLDPQWTRRIGSFMCVQGS